MLNLNAVIVGLQFLFLEPNASDPLNKEAANDLMTDLDRVYENLEIFDGWVERERRELRQGNDMIRDDSQLQGPIEIREMKHRRERRDIPDRERVDDDMRRYHTCLMRMTAYGTRRSSGICVKI